MLAPPRAIPAVLRASVVGLSALAAALTWTPGPALAAPPPAPRPSAAVAAGDVGLSAVGGSASPTLPGGDPVDTDDRAAVGAAYRAVYERYAGIRGTAPSSESVRDCRTQVAPIALQEASLGLVNYVRTMSGVRPVRLDPALSRAAQKAALAMHEKGQLSRSPEPGSWRCWSLEGAEAAQQANLDAGDLGAAAVRAHMDNADDPVAGQRWWLQRPTVESIGSGTVGGTNVLWVPHSTGYLDGPSYTSWPSAGYFPAGLEPNGRWSFTPWHPAYNLDAATVSVTGPGGSALPVTARLAAAPDPALVFDLGALPRPTGDRVDAYTVTISGIRFRGEPIGSHTYQVRLIDPYADVLSAVERPAVSGSGEVGRLLSASAPTWSHPGIETRYQWLRDGVAISGATANTYTVSSADLGTTLGLRATGTKAGSEPVPVSSPQTVLVPKLAPTVTATAGSPEPRTVRLVAAVAAPDGSVPSGTVEVREGEKVLASALPLDAGTATLALSEVSPGGRLYTVTYSGSATLARSQTTTAVQVADRTPAVLSLTTTSAAVGQLAVTVGVRAGGEVVPAGTVSVRVGSTTLARDLRVTSSGLRWSARGLKPGRHTVTVTYSGTGRVLPTTSSATVTVKAKAKPTVTLAASSPAKGKIKIAIGVRASGQRPLGGTVVIKDGNKIVTRAPVKGGKATYTASKIKSGRHTYTATYGGTSEVTTASARASIKVR